jgi:hypothetical protein
MQVFEKITQHIILIENVFFLHRQDSLCKYPANFKLKLDLKFFFICFCLSTLISPRVSIIYYSLADRLFQIAFCCIKGYKTFAYQYDFLVYN